jgi:hypothetical protein
VRAEDPAATELLAPFDLAADRAIRGRDGSMDVWVRRDA